MKVHRVHLSDEEIVRVARALKWFTDMLREKGLLSLEERLAYERVARRLEDWREVKRRPRR